MSEWRRPRQRPTCGVGSLAGRHRRRRWLFLLLGFVSIVWTPYPVTALDVGSAMQDPSGGHWLGTDELGRDVLSLVMKGTLTSFIVAAIAVAIGGLVGVPLGLAAARLAATSRTW